MNKVLSSKGLTVVNLLIVAYFSLLYLVNHYQLKSQAIQVVGELLTIPFLIALVVFTAIGIKYLTQSKKQFWTVVSIVLLGLCAIATVKSFF
ncbi:hypothetical protein [Gilvibacter sp.]|uniref:hypothetical protein n=1 Tax=Gilvibacter sp. TaxID=2729997 RepID=UPI0025B9B0DB|nr:hypothetical protein [Gilvibacter sp.]NQX78361.1 hypothetical protein [Gilvibacter sp.]